MNDALQQLVAQYISSDVRPENALREVVQHLALLGLWRSGFYRDAAFYGGTALRIFYGLNRFSEDMDFSLLAVDPACDLTPHLNAIQNELTGFGLKFSVQKKEKSAKNTIESAFLKGNTAQNLLVIDASLTDETGIHRHQTCKIKLEVDTDPPAGASFEMKTLLVPIPFQVKLFSLPDLFAGKLHAVLCRGWKSRVKGRDYYDLVWYVGRNVPCNLSHLCRRMIQSGHLSPEDKLNKTSLIDMLHDRFGKVDFKQAANDVRPFLKDPDALKLWNRKFFEELVLGIKVESESDVVRRG